MRLYGGMCIFRRVPERLEGSSKKRQIGLALVQIGLPVIFSPVQRRRWAFSAGLLKQLHMLFIQSGVFSSLWVAGEPSLKRSGFT